MLQNNMYKKQSRKVICEHGCVMYRELEEVVFSLSYDVYHFYLNVCLIHFTESTHGYKYATGLCR